MGCIDTIRWNSFPAQSDRVGDEVVVCFHYDLENEVHGQVIRDDREPPMETLIMLDDGRVVRGSECQYRVIR